MEESSDILRVCTAFMPPLDYFAALVRAGRFYVDTDETYRKQTFRNRALIVTSQGVLCLSVPCVKPRGNHTPVSEVRMGAQGNWQREHWRGIVTAYNKSPYFLYYKDELEDFYRRPLRDGDGNLLRLAGFNAGLLDFFIRKLRLPVERIREKPPSLPVGEGEKRYVPPMDFSPKSPVKFDFEPYLQTFPCVEDRGRLSILDLLFNLGPEAAFLLESARPHPDRRCPADS